MAGSPPRSIQERITVVYSHDGPGFDEAFFDEDGYVRIPLLRALPGAAGASLGWLVFSSLFSVYVQHFGSYSVFYGSLAGIAMAMLWLYVCMSILFYGGVLNCLLFERRSQQGK